MSVVVLQLENTEGRWNWVGQRIRVCIPFCTFVGSVGFSKSLIIGIGSGRGGGLVAAHAEVVGGGLDRGPPAAEGRLSGGQFLFLLGRV